tara:strand:+ start:741 stop:989 length:249 start_codon:yes stop_codon:yes gene_type:complete
MKLNKQRLMEMANLTEGGITLDDKDVEIIRAALSLASNQLKNKTRLTADERSRLNKLLVKFSIDVDNSGSDVDAMAKQLDRR